MSKSITITLPLPPRELHPNARVHWRVKAIKVKNARAVAGWRTCNISGRAQPWAKAVTLQARYYFPTRRKRDDDGLVGWLKSYRDGVADALGMDDNNMRMERMPTWGVDKANPRVELVVTEVVAETAGTEVV